jgi:NAD(P) transhydrogenase subunit beta
VTTEASPIAGIAEVAYLVAAVLFIVGIKQLGRVRTARRGNQLAGVAMLIAIVATLAQVQVIDAQWILIGLAVGGLVGAVSALRVPMTRMPEFVALFNGSGGGASALVAISVVWFAVVERQAAGTLTEHLGVAPAVTVVLSVLVGAVTLSGSVVAYLKLAEIVLGGKPTLLPGRHAINAVLLLGALGLGGYLAFGATDPDSTATAMLALTTVSLLLGVLLVIPIGGADMPVVISLLNSYSGVAASMTGFVLGNHLLIISGAAVGAAGIILTKVMCDAMNRSLANVIFGGFGAVDTSPAAGGGEYKNVRSCSAEEAAIVLEDAASVVIAPGYGLAVAQAQHAVRELADLLKKRGCAVRYAIHPVAGRMPGHMNVLLAEADVPYEELLEMDAINPELKDTDVAIVLGANDVVNPDALTNPQSPIYGMPILRVHEARTVFIVKRSLGAGFAGIKNTLFEAPNASMVFGDAKKVVMAIVGELKGAA